MSILTGFKKVKNYILTSSGYQLLSRWTSSQTVEFDDGKTAQAKLGEINGIAKTYVDMKKAIDNSMAASAKAVMEGLENSSALISMTQAEYDALSDEERTDNNMRAILDANPDVVDAKNVNFDNTDTNLTATNTQSAITELNGKLNNIKSEWIYLYGNDSSECYLKYKIEGTTCYVDAFIPITITTTSGWSLSSLLSAPLPKSKRTNAMAANFPAQCYYPNICVFGRMTTGGAIAVFANNSAFSLQTYNFAFNFTYEIYTSTAPIADVNL